MTKNVFIDKLEEALKEAGVDKTTRKDIIEDYENIIDEALMNDEDEALFIEKLGKPRMIVKNLLKTTKVNGKDSKLIAISPFIALILFFFLGFSFDAWHPGWLSFLLIPITAITLESRGFDRIIALSVFVILITFMLLGTYFMLWHPMWALFIYIAGLGFLSDKKAIIKLFGVYTLFGVTAFIFYELLLSPEHLYHLLFLVPIPIFGVLSGSISITIKYYGEVKTSYILAIAGLILLIVLIYLGLGYFYGLWHPAWIVFLLIPVITIAFTQWQSKEIEWVPYMPFIALWIFILWGHYGNAYHYSWLAFLIIPIVAILEE